MDISGRDIIIVAAILVAVYLLVSLLRLSQIGRRQAGQGIQKKSRKTKGQAAQEMTSQTSSPSTSSSPAAHWSERPTLADEAWRGATPDSFATQLQRSSLETEVQQLRQEVAELRDAIAQLMASQRVSPQYNEAMRLAQRGLDAQVIADQCAISIGEAELVAALSRNKQDFGELEHDDRSYDRRG